MELVYQSNKAILVLPLTESVKDGLTTRIKILSQRRYIRAICDRSSITDLSSPQAHFADITLCSQTHDQIFHAHSILNGHGLLCNTTNISAPHFHIKHIYLITLRRCQYSVPYVGLKMNPYKMRILMYQNTKQMTLAICAGFLFK